MGTVVFKTTAIDHSANLPIKFSGSCSTLINEAMGFPSISLPAVNEPVVSLRPSIKQCQYEIRVLMSLKQSVQMSTALVKGKFCGEI